MILQVSLKLQNDQDKISGQYLDNENVSRDEVLSVSGTLDRLRVVATSKTCGYVRSSRRRWR